MDSYSGLKKGRIHTASVILKLKKKKSKMANELRPEIWTLLSLWCPLFWFTTVC